MVKSTKLTINTAGQKVGMSNKICRCLISKSLTWKNITIIGLLIDMKSTTNPKSNTKTQLHGFYNTHTPIKQAILEAIKHTCVIKSGTKVRQRPLQNIHSKKEMIKDPNSSLSQGPTDAPTSTQVPGARPTSGEDRLLHVLVCITALSGHVIWLKGKPTDRKAMAQWCHPPATPDKERGLLKNVYAENSPGWGGWNVF